MKKLLCILLFFLGLSGFSQNVGINTPAPTATIDVNGNMRIRNIPNTTQPHFILTASDSGYLFRIPYDSLPNTQTTSPSIQTFVSGDTITAGDLVAIGDGVSGVALAYSGLQNGTDDPATTTTWRAQTFKTGQNTKSIKGFLLSLVTTSTSYPVTFICSIRNTSSGSPVGNDLYNQTATISGNLDNGNTFARIIFNPPVQVLPNTTYSLIMRSSLGNNNFRIIKSNTGLYSNGLSLISTNSGASWIQQSCCDYYFTMFECVTNPGEIFRADQSFVMSNCVGYNTTISCIESLGCPPANTYFGKRDLLDNPIGIAQNNALPGQNVTVQLSGTATVSGSFPPGRPLFMGTSLGSLSVTPLNSSRQIGLSLGGNKILLRISNQ